MSYSLSIAADNAEGHLEDTLEAVCLPILLDWADAPLSVFVSLGIFLGKQGAEGVYLRNNLRAKVEGRYQVIQNIRNAIQDAAKVIKENGYKVALVTMEDSMGFSPDVISGETYKPQDYAPFPMEVRNTRMAVAVRGYFLTDPQEEYQEVNVQNVLKTMSSYSQTSNLSPGCVSALLVDNLNGQVVSIANGRFIYRYSVSKQDCAFTLLTTMPVNRWVGVALCVLEHGPQTRGTARHWFGLPKHFGSNVTVSTPPSQPSYSVQMDWKLGRKREHDFCCLISGGVDSMLAIGLALKLSKPDASIHLLFFNYGQTSLVREREAVRCQLEYLESNFGHVHFVLKEIDVSELIHSLVPSNMTEGGFEFNTPQDVIVPARNLLFSTMALAYCEGKKIPSLGVGINIEVNSSFPDVNSSLLESLTNAARSGTTYAKEVWSPHKSLPQRRHAFAMLEKLFKDLPPPPVWSCYSSNETPCGTCLKCETDTVELQLSKLETELGFN